ncbi:MAG: hypothetical protein JRN24_02455, partial [Nitrososphaerota archaeon]|nr:hypothetical protein [Nitrososphaerota archaeon]
MDTDAYRLPDELRVAYEAGVEYGHRLAAAEIAALRAENAELRRRLDEVELLMGALRARAEMNSSNSSLPPSSDRPADRERLKHAKQAKQAGGGSGGDSKTTGAGDNPSKPPQALKKRKRGAQPGHKGAYRNDATKPDEVIEVWPKQCPRCQMVLPEALPEARAATRRKVWDFE